jgi:glycosyltransferase involved in cell wall biosynthesis
VRILSFSYCYPSADRPNWGIFVHHRLRALAGQIEALEVVSPRPHFPPLRRAAGESRDEFDGVAVHRPRFFCVPGLLKSLDPYFYARSVEGCVRGVIERLRPELLDAHFVWPDGVAAGILARRLGLEYAITLRGKIYPCLYRPAQKLQVARALRGASAVVSVSEPMARLAVSLGADARRVRVIPNGVDRERFGIRDRLACRRELGLEPNGRLLVTVAHLGPRKGHREALRALAELPPDVRLLIAGGDPAGGRCTQRLRALAGRLGVGDRLILPGPVPHEKIPLYFSAADASVLASYREGCPNVVLESLAAGTPVIASDVGAVRQILAVPACGRIVPARSVGPLAEAIAAVLDAPRPAADVLADSGVRSWRQVAADLAQTFRGALAPQSPLPENAP